MKKTAIMGAMPEEVDVIRQSMVGITEECYGGRTYYSGKIANIDVVLVFSRWGKVAAATTASTLITKFGVEQIIFTGVAGAVSPGLRIGDVVISDKLYQHDMDASPLFPKHEIPLTGVTFFNADAMLMARAQTAAAKLLENPGVKIPLGVLTAFDIKEPTCHVGMIASGDQFVAGGEAAKVICAGCSAVMAVEMEGAAVAQVCQEHAVPFVVIRTISDCADTDAPIDFQTFVRDVARHYSDFVVNHMLCSFAEVRYCEQH